VVHESTQDAQVHHLEELQVVDSKTVHRAVNSLLHWTAHLHNARSDDAPHIQPVVSAVRRGVHCRLSDFVRCPNENQIQLKKNRKIFYTLHWLNVCFLTAVLVLLRFSAPYVSSY